MLNCRTKRIEVNKRVWFVLQPEILCGPRDVRRDTCTHREIFISWNLLLCAVWGGWRWEQSRMSEEGLCSLLCL